MIHRNVVHGLSIIALVSLAACPDEDVTPTSFTAVTYNGGLAVGFVSAAEERSSATIQAVAALSADVVCVQEFWTPDHVNVLATATASAFPHALFMDPDVGTVGPAGCTVADTEELLGCVETAGCDQVCGDDLIGCVLANCAVEFTAMADVAPACSGCVQANVGAELNQIVSTCRAESTEFAFGGAFGIGLLSKHPIISQDEVILDSTTNRRGLLYAEVNVPNLGSVHVVCTHLTAVFSAIPYPKATGSWEEEQLAQVNALNTLVDAKAGADGRVVVLGDFNTGPAGTGYIAEAEANYTALMAAGYSNPYIDWADHTCTFCGDNPLIGNDDTESAVIDHVLTRNFTGTSTAKRVLDGPLDVTPVCSGTVETLAYSDHYGVSVTFTEGP